MDSKKLYSIESGFTVEDFEALYGNEETPERIESELSLAVKENLEYAPPEIAGQVHQAAKELFGEIHQLKIDENEYGHSDAWENFTNNKVEIKEELHALGVSLHQSQKIAEKLISHAVEQGCQKVVGAFHKGRDFIYKHQQQIRLRTPEESLAADLAEMERLRQRLGKYIENAPQETQAELLKVQENWDRFSQKVHQVKNVEYHPLITENAIDKKSLNKITLDIGKRVRNVRQSIDDFPIAVHNAITDKSRDLLSKACNKMLSTFDKAMAFLDKQRKKIMDFAPDVKLDHKASPEKIYVAHAQNAVLYDPALSGKELDIQIASSLRKVGYSDRKIKECIAQSPAFKDLSLKERTAKISHLMKEVNKSREVAYSR